VGGRFVGPRDFEEGAIQTLPSCAGFRFDDGVLETLRQRLIDFFARAIQPALMALRGALAPTSKHGAVTGLLLDVVRSRRELIAENALLRQQLLVVARQVKRPKLRGTDRFVLVALAALFTNWRNALLLVQPETLLRWHRDLFRHFWRRMSKPKSAPAPRLAATVIALIRRMAIENRLWGAKRIRGELLKLGFDVAKSTVQRYISRFRSSPPSQRWLTFLRNQAAGIWCCDLFEVRDLWFRCPSVFVVMHLESRRIVHAVTTRAPTGEWLAQQLRELTPFGEGPKFLLRDNDAKFGTVFDDVAKGAGIRVIRTPILAPKANCHVERLIGSLRRECLDHVLVLNDGHLRRMLDEYAGFYNQARPHQGIEQRRPDSFAKPALSLPTATADRVTSRPVLGGLHHDYRIAA
jgi:transposase InsO family protein